MTRRAILWLNEWMDVMNVESMDCICDQANMNVLNAYGYVYGYGYRCRYGCDDGLYEMYDEIKDWAMIVDLVQTCETLLMQGQPSQTLDLTMWFLGVRIKHPLG